LDVWWVVKTVYGKGVMMVVPMELRLEYVEAEMMVVRLETLSVVVLDGYLVE